ncbi:NTP transferase domain-containing protein [candidate division WOR-3 bacterium]|nr:NTP transferase domain-containing protein [candidate division WOR-3 bacterium]
MTGVIIAAGKGERLSNITGGKPKTLLVINGKPIIQWIIDELSASGVEKVLIVTGYQSEKIKHYFKINPHENIKFVYNNLWEEGNGISVLSVGKLVKKESEFLLMMSDHLIGRKVIKDIIKEKKRCPLLAVEKKLGKVFDIDDATKVIIDNGKVISIGKELKKFNGVDAGLFLLDFSVFRFLKRSIKKGEDTLTGGIKKLIKQRELHSYSIPDDDYWIDIDSEDTYNKAMQMWRIR